MKKEIRIYIEGDTKNKGKNTDITLRQGFNAFFRELIEEAKNKNTTLRPITYGSKFETFKKFLDGVREYQDSFVLFLLDSDAPLEENETPKAFLKKQNPAWHLHDVEENQCHLMVHLMEAWFYTDKDKLAEYYGKDFNRNALVRNTNVEKIPKADVENGLANATRNTQKGEYHKTRHGAKILELINPQFVCNAAPNCKRLFEIVQEKLKN
ncbi:MAG: DUF4276 family protein [Pyrinomonadaceae bacterium]